MARGFGAGLSKLNNKLTRTIPDNAKKAAAASVVQGASEIVSMQKSLAPVEDGDLQMSITYTPPGGTTPPYSQPGGSQIAREGQALVTAGNTKVRYAHLVEFGTAPHDQGGMFAGTKHPGTAQQGFFWPGYRAVRTRVKSRVTRTINKAVKDGAT